MGNAITMMGGYDNSIWSVETLFHIVCEI